MFEIHEILRSTKKFQEFENNIFFNFIKKNSK